jgi:hypothetical protein
LRPAYQLDPTHAPTPDDRGSSAGGLRASGRGSSPDGRSHAHAGARARRCLARPDGGLQARCNHLLRACPHAPDDTRARPLDATSAPRIRAGQTVRAREKPEHRRVVTPEDVESDQLPWSRTDSGLLLRLRTDPRPTRKRTGRDSVGDAVPEGCPRGMGRSSSGTGTSGPRDREIGRKSQGRVERGRGRRVAADGTASIQPLRTFRGRASS